MTDPTLPPQSADAERCVLAAMLRDNATIDDVLPLLCPEDFYSDAHQRLYRVIGAMRNAGKPVDAVTLYEALESRGEAKDAGGGAYLMQLWETSAPVANVSYYAGIVAGKALSRRLIFAANEVLTRAYGGEGSASEQLESAERAFFALSDLGGGGKVRSMSEIIRDVMQRIEQRQIRGRADGLPCGMGSLDAILGGWQPGCLHYLAARPGVGKTAVMGFLARYLVGVGANVLIVSLEQSDAELVERLLSGESAIPLHRLRNGRILQEEFDPLVDARNVLAAATLVIDDKPGQSVTRIAANARRLKSRGLLDVLFVDYLQLIEAENRREPRHEQIAGISRGLRLMARDLAVPVIALAQLNRESEARGDGKPKLSDLRESGQLEQDAHVVMLLHRPDVQQPELLDVIVAKNRNGPVGEVNYRFQRELMRFSELPHASPDYVRTPFTEN